MLRRLLPLLLLALLPRLAPAQSLYADPKARAVGDPITVVLAERTSAKSHSQYADASQSALSGSGNLSGGTVNGRFGMDANVSSNAAARSEAAQGDLLSGTLTVVVVGVDEQGNLQVEGERKLSVNGADHYMRVRGTVRPYDIRYDNSVLSYQIANADVEYRQGGMVNKFLSPGTLVKAGAVVLLALAALLGAS